MTTPTPAKQRTIAALEVELARVTVEHDLLIEERDRLLHEVNLALSDEIRRLNAIYVP